MVSCRGFSLFYSTRLLREAHPFALNLAAGHCQCDWNVQDDAADQGPSTTPHAHLKEQVRVMHVETVLSCSCSLYCRENTVSLRFSMLIFITPLNRHEKVQENCIDLVGRIADRGAEFVSGRYVTCSWSNIGEREV